MNARRAEFRAFARDSEIAARDKLAACGGRDTFNRCNDGLGQVHNLLHHGAATPENIDKIGAAPVRIGAAGGHFLQIMACAEDGACRGKDDSADGAILRNTIQHFGQRMKGSFRERVAGVGAVQRQNSGTVVFGDGERGGQGCVHCVKFNSLRRCVKCRGFWYSVIERERIRYRFTPDGSPDAGRAP